MPTATPNHDRLAAAETDLRATLADIAAARLHPSSRGLIGFVAARIHPIDRLHELSRRLTAAGAPADQDFYDYRFILDAVSSPASTFPRTEVVRGDDLTDWLLVMRQRDEAATARALERWHADKAQVWLVAEGDRDRLTFRAISDSAIVSGLIALLLRVYSGRSAAEILATAMRRLPSSQ